MQKERSLPVWYSCLRSMSSIVAAPSSQQTQADQLAAQIQALQATIEEKTSKGRKLRGVLATKTDKAVANDLRRQLDLPRSS